MALVATGDSDAFERLYDEVSAQVHGLVLCCVADASAAEEITQRVFVQVWARAPRYDGSRTTALIWIMTLAHHHVVGWLRQPRTGEDRGARVIPSSQARSAAAYPALSVLTPSEAESLELAFFRGYTRAEIGAIYLEPTDAVSARLRDALTQLRAATVER